MAPNLGAVASAAASAAAAGAIFYTATKTLQGMSDTSPAISASESSSTIAAAANNIIATISDEEISALLPLKEGVQKMGRFADHLQKQLVHIIQANENRFTIDPKLIVPLILVATLLFLLLVALHFVSITKSKSDESPDFLSPRTTKAVDHFYFPEEVTHSAPSKNATAEKSAQPEETTTTSIALVAKNKQDSPTNETVATEMTDLTAATENEVACRDLVRDMHTAAADDGKDAEVNDTESFLPSPYKLMENTEFISANFESPEQTSVPSSDASVADSELETIASVATSASATMRKANAVTCPGGKYKVTFRSPYKKGKFRTPIKGKKNIL